MYQYSQEDPEYIDNGHYRINGVEYMSVWTYKNIKRIEPNTNRDNGADGKALIAKGYDYRLSAPDFGPFRDIFIYRPEDLQNYYRK